MKSELKIIIYVAILLIVTQLIGFPATIKQIGAIILSVIIIMLVFFVKRVDESTIRKTDSSESDGE
jgi:hypothetical protein